MSEIGLNGDTGQVIPSETSPLDNQVAGHRFGHCVNQLGLLRHNSSKDILKPICDKRSERELQLYESIWSEDNDCDQTIVELRHFVPKFNGIFLDQNNGNKFLRLQDITLEFSNPSVLDIKIGPKTYDIEANDDKIKSETNKYKFAQEIGFRILGMRIYDPISKDYIIRDKDYGIQLTPNNINQGLELFVRNNKSVVKQYCKQLNAINDWFNNYNIDRYQFISSSLLFVHDFSQNKSVVKMIDFAHVFPNTGRDNNYLYGLKMIIKYFNNI